VFAKQPGSVINGIKGQQTDGVRTLATSGYNTIANVKQLSSTKLVLVFATIVGTQSTTETAYFAKQ
jgi:hypothetical protein